MNAKERALQIYNRWTGNCVDLTRIMDCDKPKLMGYIEQALRDTERSARVAALEEAAKIADGHEHVQYCGRKIAARIRTLIPRASGGEKPQSSSIADVLSCGCTVTKGYRCPVHDGP